VSVQCRDAMAHVLVWTTLMASQTAGAGQRGQLDPRGKAHIPIIVLPTDLAPEMDSVGLHGDPIKVYPRPVDLENVGKLRGFERVTVVKSVEELERCLDTCL